MYRRSDQLFIFNLINNIFFYFFVFYCFSLYMHLIVIQMCASFEFMLDLYFLVHFLFAKKNKQSNVIRIELMDVEDLSREINIQKIFHISSSMTIDYEQTCVVVVVFAFVGFSERSSKQSA